MLLHTHPHVYRFIHVLFTCWFIQRFVHLFRPSTHLPVHCYKFMLRFFHALMHFVFKHLFQAQHTMNHCSSCLPFRRLIRLFVYWLFHSWPIHAFIGPRMPATHPLIVSRINRPIHLHSFVRTSIHSLICSSIQSPIFSRVLPFGESWAHCFSWCIGSLIEPFSDWMVQRFINSAAQSFIHWFVRSFIRPLIYLFIRLTIHSVSSKCLISRLFLSLWCIDYLFAWYFTNSFDVACSDLAFLSPHAKSIRRNII